MFAHQAMTLWAILNNLQQITARDICPKSNKVEFEEKIKTSNEKSPPAVATIGINAWETIQSLAIALGNKILKPILNRYA